MLYYNYRKGEQKKFNSGRSRGKVEVMKTLNFVLGTEEEIQVGKNYYFGQLWDGEEGNAEELLESGAVSPDDENVVAFEIVKTADDLLQTVVKVTDIY